MQWWKIGVYGSLAWFLVIIGLSVGLMWRIEANPMGENIDEVRSEQAGQTVGMLLFIGLVAVWSFAYVRHKRQATTDSDDPRSSSEAEEPAESIGLSEVDRLSGESFVIVRRAKNYADRLRTYKVMVDNIVVATMSAGESVDFAIEPGNHRIQIWVDWASSKKLRFDAKPGECSVFECRSNLTGMRIFLAILYVLFLRDQYLVLRQLTSQPATNRSAPPPPRASQNPYQSPGES
jgi:hypothetical protein